MLNSIFSNPAVIWMIIGVFFLLLEFVVPGLIIIFFGVGALTTAGALLLFDLSLTAQLFLFLISSGLSLALFRKTLHRKFFKKTEKLTDELHDEFVGKPALAIIDFANNTGKVEFKGAAWKAIAEESIQKGDTVEIIKKDSITLYVKPIK